MKKTEKSISSFLRTISSTPRLRILLGIGAREVCVCHLEALLGWRQAYLSQHLMALRRAKVLVSRRAGRFVYYRLRDPRTLDILRQAAEIMEVRLSALPIPDNCVCPTCSPADSPVALESA
jgi:ArsR family transcriptional regulator